MAVNDGAELPPAVAALLRDHVETYEELEVLLALHAAPAVAHDEHELATTVRAQPELVAAALAGLVARGLVVREAAGARAAYRYAPANPDDAAAVDGLAVVHATQPLSLVKAMSANAIERVRAAAARTFADAFVFRRNGDDG